MNDKLENLEDMRDLLEKAKAYLDDAQYIWDDSLVSEEIVGKITNTADELEDILGDIDNEIETLENFEDEEDDEEEN